MTLRLDRVLARYFAFPWWTDDWILNRWLDIFFFISNHQQNYRKGHVFSNQRTYLISQTSDMLQFFANFPYPWYYFSISCIPITFSSNIPYPGNFFPQISRIPKTPNRASFVLGHYLFLETCTFPRTTISENCSLLRTDRMCSWNR